MSPAVSASPSATAAPSRRITLPKSFTGYRRETGNVAKRLTDDIREGMAQAGGEKVDTDLMKTGLYSSADARLVFVGFTYADFAARDLLGDAHSPSTAVDQVFFGLRVSNTNDFPPGKLGGVVRCGKAAASGTSLAACAWADQATLGMLVTPDLSVKKLAKAIVRLRTAAER